MLKRYYESKRLMIWTNTSYLVFGITKSTATNIYGENDFTISIFIIHFTFFIKKK